MEGTKMVPPTKPHFIKPFLPGCELQLRIPVAFLKRQNCDNMVLREANGKLWDVKVNEGMIQEGWKEFAREHSLRVGDFLVFRHEADKVFDVMIFGENMCEREYPSSTVPYEIKNQTLDPSGVDVKVENDTLDQEGASTKKIKDGFSLLKNSSFKVTVASNYVLRSEVRIPIAFTKKNCLRNVCCEILLVNQHGKTWGAMLNYNKRHGYAFIGDGWSTFSSENNFNCGDSFIFECIRKGKKYVFKMHGLRKAKRNPNPGRKALPTYDLKSASSSIRNPYFIASVSMSNSKKYEVIIPRQFVRTNRLCREICEITLEDELGKPWPMCLRPCADGAIIGKGWWNFVKAKGLEKGDGVILELVKNGKKPVMKFHGLQNAKRNPNSARKALPTYDVKSASSSIRNPYFIASVSVSSSKKNEVVIPRQFARTNRLCREICEISVEDELGKPWPMCLRPGADGAIIGRGWWGFVKAKGLEKGDGVILELVKNGKKPAMKFRGITK